MLIRALLVFAAYLGDLVQTDSILKSVKCYPSYSDSKMGDVLHNIGDIGNITSEEVQQIRRALLENGVVVIRNQTLSRQQQVHFSSKLGETITLPLSFEGKDPEAGFPEIHRVSNYWYNGTWKGPQHCFGCYWHKDGDYNNPDRDYIIGILYAEHVADSSAQTAFLDNCNAISLLPPGLKSSIYNTTIAVSVRKIPDFKSGTERDFALFPDEALHDVFYRHPENGRQCLYLTNEMDTKKEKSSKEQRDLEMAWKLMTEFSPKYRHKWRNGDLVIWDNVGVMHRAMPAVPSREPRILYRTMARITMV